MILGSGFIAIVLTTGLLWIYSTENNQSGGHTGVNTAACEGPGAAAHQAGQPKSGGVEVAHQGVDFVSDESRSGGTLSFGVELENTSDRVARDISVQVNVLDSKGELVEERKAGDWQGQSLERAYLSPGATTAVSADGEFRYAGGAALPKGDLSLEIDIDVAEWWTEGNGERFGQAKAFEVDTAFEPWPGESEVSLGDWEKHHDPVMRNFVAFRVDSDFCEPVQLGAIAVFRDGDDNIIGASRSSEIAVAATDKETGEVALPDGFDGNMNNLETTQYEPGKSEPMMVFPALSAQNFNAYSIYDNADPDATEVYLFEID